VSAFHLDISAYHHTRQIRASPHFNGPASSTSSLTFAPQKHRNTHTHVQRFILLVLHLCTRLEKTGLYTASIVFHSSVYSSRVSIPLDYYTPRWSGPETCLPRQPCAVQLAALTRQLYLNTILLLLLFLLPPLSPHPSREFHAALPAF